MLSLIILKREREGRESQGTSAVVLHQPKQMTLQELRSGPMIFLRVSWGPSPPQIDQDPWIGWCLRVPLIQRSISLF